MKILQIIPALESGGVERGTLDLVRALHQQGHEAHVASSGGRMVHRLEWHGGIHHQLPLQSKNPWIMWRNSKKLEAIIRKHEIDIIHARSRAPAWSALWAAKRTNTKFVTTFHGTYNFDHFIKKYYNSVMTKADRVIAISEFIKQHILKHYRLEEDKISVILRGVDLEHFHVTHVRTDQLQTISQKWRLPDDCPIIIMPGRLTRWKGHLHVLDALALLAKKMGRSINPNNDHKNENKPFHCIFIGDTNGAESYIQEITKKTEQLKLDGMVQMVGHTDDIPASLMLADVVFSASLDPEAFGRVVVEGQAMGRPVIAPAHGGALEQIEHGVTGWLYPVGDHEALANCLYEAIGLNQGARARLAARTRQFVEEKFSLETMTAQTIALYQGLLESKTNNGI